MSFLLDTNILSTHLRHPSGLAHLMIGSVALVYDLTLVTHNTTDFQNIPGLRLEVWLTP